MVKRPIKNINGDIVTDFTLTEFETIRVSGIAFEVDLATDDYKKKIRSHSKMLLNNIDEPSIHHIMSSIQTVSLIQPVSRFCVEFHMI